MQSGSEEKEFKLIRAAYLSPGDIFYKSRDSDLEEPLKCVGREEEFTEFVTFDYENRPDGILKSIKENRLVWKRIN